MPIEHSIYFERVELLPRDSHHKRGRGKTIYHTEGYQGVTSVHIRIGCRNCRLDKVIDIKPEEIEDIKVEIPEKCAECNSCMARADRWCPECNEPYCDDCYFEGNGKMCKSCYDYEYEKAKELVKEYEEEMEETEDV